jgi:hypothetical protein
VSRGERTEFARDAFPAFTAHDDDVGEVGGMERGRAFKVSEFFL